MFGSTRPGTSTPPTGPSLDVPLPTVPGPFFRRLLLFEFVALIEYWLAPLFLGVSNYAGIWSTVGYLLFATLATTLVIGVFAPLRPHLRSAFERPFRRTGFHALWVSGLLVSLVATNTLQWSASAGATPVTATTVYTPFGAWPGVSFGVPYLHLLALLNLEILIVLVALSVLWASAIVLGFGRAPNGCPRPEAEDHPWRHRLAAAAFWGPLGFMTSCSYCTPLYVVGLSVVAPGVAIGAYDAIPLVPWIGLSGLLGLLSLILTLRVLQRATAPASSDASPDPFGGEGTP